MLNRREWCDLIKNLFDRKEIFPLIQYRPHSKLIKFKGYYSQKTMLEIISVNPHTSKRKKSQPRPPQTNNTVFFSS